MNEMNKIDFKTSLKRQFEVYEQGLNGNKDLTLFNLRKEAFSNFFENGLPNQKSEYWKYNNLNFLNRIDFKISRNIPSSDLIFENKNIKKVISSINSYQLVINNGFLIESLSALDELKKAGVIVSKKQVLNNNTLQLVKETNGAINWDKNPFAAINTAFFNEVVSINISKNIALEKPILIINYISDENENLIINNRIKLEAEKGCDATVINSYFLQNENQSLINELCECEVEENAQLSYVQLQNYANQLITTTHCNQAKDSHFDSFVLTLDGKYIRNNLSSEHQGQNCETYYYGTFISNKSNFIDNHTFVDHAQANCYSEENYKGIIDDKGTGVFNGKILVRQDAQKTNAYQSNKNILLSDNATINTKPELEIYADDVKCSHGATSGALDYDLIFYLRTRGLSEDMAKSILLSAFALETLSKIKNEELRKFVINEINKKLNLSFE